MAAKRPSDVIADACQAIAGELAKDGCSYAKSKRVLRRLQGSRVFEVWFQSDRNNLSVVRAVVWIHAGVKESGSTRFLAGGQIGNLSPEPSWMEWDFADEVACKRIIADAVAAIRRMVLPFFASFEPSP